MAEELVKDETVSRIQGTPASHEIFTVEIYDEDEGWLNYEDPSPTAAPFFTQREPARQLAYAVSTDNEPARVVQWYRLATSDRQHTADFRAAKLARQRAEIDAAVQRHPAGTGS